MDSDDVGVQGMMHSSSEEEMRDVKQFLAQCLP